MELDDGIQTDRDGAVSSHQVEGVSLQIGVHMNILLTNDPTCGNLFTSHVYSSV